MSGGVYLPVGSDPVSSAAVAPQLAYMQQLVHFIIY